MPVLVRPPRLQLPMALAIGGPALAIGGVWPATIPAFAVVVALALVLLWRTGTELRIPTATGIGALATAATLLQVLPLPGLRGLAAPRLHAWVEHVGSGLDATGWPSLTPVPADTGLEVVRLLALTALVLVCAQRSWRTTAAIVASTGAVVAVIGLVQHGLRIDRIYGLYEAQHPTTGRETTLLSTFVNPNHQSGLLLLGVFATAGLSLGHARRRARLELRLVLGIALLLQLAALVLSSSRAALLAGAVAGALAAGLAVATGPRHRRRSPRAWATGTLPWFAVLVGMVVGLGSLGAWDELASLLGSRELDASTELRLHVMAGSLSLLDLAPTTGIGRGAFSDVFTAFDPAPSHVWISHLECAPLAMLVEWGLLGLVLLVAMPAWWLSAVRHTGRHEDATARRIVLLGLLAIALQGLADFSLEFLGVAAPACALAGALSPTRSRRARPPRGLVALLFGLACACPLLLPWSWATLSTTPDADQRVTDADVAARPLHAGLHRRRARAAALDGDWSTVEHRALASVRLRPASVDGWLLLSSARAHAGANAAERRAITEALGHLHRAPDAALVRHLSARFNPDVLAELAPAEDPAWSVLVAALLAHAPRHAAALASARARRAPDDPEPLRAQVEANLRLDRTSLALHHARLWRQLAPTDPHAHLAVVRTLEALGPEREPQRREALDLALAQARLDDPGLRGLIEEQLIRAMLRDRRPGDHPRLVELALALRTRPADDETRRRRLVLVDPLLRP